MSFRRAILGLLFASALTSCGFSIGTQNPTTPSADPDVKLIFAPKVSSNFLEHSHFAAEDEARTSLSVADQSSLASRTVDARKYDFLFTIDPETKAVDVLQKLRLLQVEPTPRLILDAGAQLRIQSFKINGIDAAFSRNQDTLVTDLTPAALASADLNLEIQYQIVKSERGIYFPYEAGRPAEMYTQGQTTLSRHWFVAVDRPGDKAIFEARVNTPANWKVVGNGRLLSERNLGARKEYRWATQAPMPPYLFSLNAGEFNYVHGANVNGISVGYWLTPKHAAEAQAVFGDTPNMVHWLSNYLVPYPFEKYDTILARQEGGAMEHASITKFGERIVIGALQDSTRSAEGTALHELVHQWFGDLVTCHSWDDTWLNESFASYIGLLYYREKNGEDDFYRQLQERRANYFAAESVNGALGAIVDYTTPMGLKFSAVAYQKGPLVLNYLREFLGNDIFQRGLQIYLRANAHRTAVTDDLQHAFEQAAQRPLGAFFEQWIYRKGTPELQLSIEQQVGGYKLVVKQVQPESIGLYNFDLPVRVKALNGISRRMTFSISEPEQSFDINLPYVHSILVDPTFHIVARRQVTMPPVLWSAILTDQAIPYLHRMEALEALATTITRAELNVLVSYPGNSPYLRGAALKVMALRFPDSLPTVLAALRSPLVPIQKAAIEAFGLQDFGGNQEATILRALAPLYETGRVDGIFRTLNQLVSVRRWSGFYDLIQARYQNVDGESIYGFLADGLGALADPRGLSLLEQNAMRSLATQRTAVANAIAKHPTAGAEAALEQLLFMQPTSLDFEFGRYRATVGIMGALKTMHTPGAQAILSRVLQTRSMVGYPQEAAQAILNGW